MSFRLFLELNMNKKRIGIDIMGEPGAAEAAIIAIVNFLNIYDDVEVTIFGKESIVKKNFKLLRKAKFFVNLKFEYTDVVILSTDTMKTINNKADASMLKMIESSKNNLLDAVCSSGNTLVYFFSCYTNLTLIKKTIKPALLATFPTTLNNKRFITLDVGANLNCNALDLLNFAQMAIIYFNLTINIQKPVVGILNIGIEKTKGHTIQQQLYKMLEDNKSINFYGNIEPRNVLNGVVDIVVCDG